jgi:hypothetical protein
MALVEISLLDEICKTRLRKKERERMIELIRWEDNNEADIENWFGKSQYAHLSDRAVMEKAYLIIKRYKEQEIQEQLNRRSR